MDIQGSVAIVTGGASGLGAATVRAFVANGGKAVILDMVEETANQLVSELGGAAVFAKADVTNEAEVRAAIEAAKTNFGGLNVCVNCAGIAVAGKTVGKTGAYPLDQFSKVIGVNLIGTFNVARLAAETMVNNEPNDKGERGVIINTASIAAWEGQIGQVAYAASKGGVVGMTLPMARDLSKNGVRVVTIAPGIMGTPMLAGLPQNVQDSLGAQVPFPSRLGLPEEYADLAVTIIRNSYLNGEAIRIDGALRMSPK